MKLKIFTTPQTAIYPITTKKKKVVIEKTDIYCIKQVTKVHTNNKYKQTLCTSVMRQGHSITLVILLTQILTLG